MGSYSVNIPFTTTYFILVSFYQFKPYFQCMISLYHLCKRYGMMAVLQPKHVALKLTSNSVIY
jgi:hypothetical protein